MEHYVDAGGRAGNENALKVGGGSINFTKEALEALADLDKHGQDQIPLMLRVGKVLLEAKEAKKRGEYKRWCDEELKRSPSWCSTYRRLHEDRGCLNDALSWAQEINHRWANCRSVELLLKIIKAYKKRNEGSDASSAAKPSRPKASEVIAQLKQQLNEAEDDIVALRDQLPPEVKAELRLLVAKANDAEANKKLGELARRHHWRLRDLVKEGTCSPLQVSRSTPEMAGNRDPVGGAGQGVRTSATAPMDGKGVQVQPRPAVASALGAPNPSSRNSRGGDSAKIRPPAGGLRSAANAKVH